VNKIQWVEGWIWIYLPKRRGRMVKAERDRVKERRRVSWRV